MRTITKHPKNIDIHILPSESCQIEYSIEYFYKGKKIKKCDKCFESAVVKNNRKINN
ncbi:hypothetical protein EfmJHP35_31400 (plasmid) [Enterococcus faecium]|nr:hypothetical protein EfmJHP35_31400 [Enterococcus faecium]